MLTTFSDPRLVIPIVFITYLVGFLTKPTNLRSQVASEQHSLRQPNRRILVERLDSTAPMQIDYLKLSDRLITSGLDFEAPDSWVEGRFSRTEERFEENDYTGRSHFYTYGYRRRITREALHDLRCS
jgi:hypothetical protein